MTRRCIKVTLPMLARAKTLESVGLSYPAIVRVIAVDFGLDLEEMPMPDTFRHALRHYAVNLGPVGLGHTNPRSFENFGTENP